LRIIHLKHEKIFQLFIKTVDFECLAVLQNGRINVLRIALIVHRHADQPSFSFFRDSHNSQKLTAGNK